MGYKKRTELLLLHIDDLRHSCGLSFYGEENNGYCCKSKSKYKAASGCCYSFDCPLAYEADLEDMKKYDKDVYEEWKECYSAPGSGAGYVVQYKEK